MSVFIVTEGRFKRVVLTDVVVKRLLVFVHKMFMMIHTDDTHTPTSQRFLSSIK